MMIRIASLLLVIFALQPFKSRAQNDTPLFQTLDSEALTTLLQNTQKPVLLYFHFEGCGGCVVLEKNVFSNDTVRAFLQDNFHSVEVNTLEEAGISVNKSYGIKIHPSLLFLNTEGEVNHRYVGICTPSEFIDIAKTALESENTLLSYQKKFESGNRNLDFLNEYIVKLAQAYMLSAEIVNEYLDAVPESERESSNYKEIIYKYCFFNFNIITPYGNPHFQYMLENKALFEKQFDPEQVAVRLLWLLNIRMFEAIENNEKELYFTLKQQIKPLLSGSTMNYMARPNMITAWIETAVLLETADLYFYEKNLDLKAYKKALRALQTKAWDQADALNSFAWMQFERHEEINPLFAKETLKTALKCSKRAIELKDNYAHNDTYAWLLYIKGDSKKALKKAQYAIMLAEKEGVSFEETNSLIEMINSR